MCKSLKIGELFSLLEITDEEFHELKIVIISQYSKELKEKKIGENPDFGWCGEKKKKQICFKSRITKNSDFCTEQFY